MAIKDIFKISRKTFFAPGAWVGYKNVKSETSYVWSIAKTVLGPVVSPEIPEHQETFEQAMQRLHLTEQDIHAAEKQYLVMALSFLGAGVLLGALCFVFLFKAAFAASFISLGLTALMLALAFKYHFSYFQIKCRKLGCTFEEWRQGKPLNGGGPHA